MSVEDLQYSTVWKTLIVFPLALRSYSIAARHTSVDAPRFQTRWLYSPARIALRVQP